MFQLRLTYSIGCLTLLATVFFGLVVGQVSACCWNQDVSRVTVGTELSGCCPLAGCHNSSRSYPAPCPECARHDRRQRSPVLGSGQDPLPRSPAASGWSNREFPLDSDAVGLSQARYFASRLLPDPVLHSIRTVVLLN